MWVTGVIALGALMLRDLNAIAPLVIMFFLLLYAMNNVVVLIEQSLGLLSFRPTFRIPRSIAGFGTLGCFFAMFIINPVFGLAAAMVVVAVCGYLLRGAHQDPPRGSGDWVSTPDRSNRVARSSSWQPTPQAPRTARCVSHQRVRSDESEIDAQRARLLELTEIFRIRATINVVTGDFEDQLGELQADLNISGLPRDLDFASCHRWMQRGRASAVFVGGSGLENALA